MLPAEIDEKHGSVAGELAWGWVRWQPHSALTLWYKERFGNGTKRMRRIGIVALARKLLIALWKYVEHDEIPEGAVFMN
jgi:transposase